MRFPSACARIAICFRPRSIRSRSTLRISAKNCEARVQDLGSPAASLLEPLLPSDPTLETLRVAEALQPANAPQRLHGVWFDRAGERALLAIETKAAGFDPTGQQLAVNAIHDAFAQARGTTQSAMTLTGPGAFSVEIGGRTQREASWIGMVDTIGLILLLLIAYRNWRTPLFGVLPLASAGLAGLGAVALLFEGVHGITVAFGFTLIGVVQDYPIHLFSHQRAGISPWANARAIWPTLATGVASTCIAYVTFLFSGVDGLQQLAVFTIAGLGVAALTTRLLLPALIDPNPRDPAASPRLAALWQRIARVPQPGAFALGALAALTLAIVAFAPGAFWQNDLSKLTPVPADALAQDARLRDELGAPDVRWLIAVRGANADDALAAYRSAASDARCLGRRRHARWLRQRRAHTAQRRHAARATSAHSETESIARNTQDRGRGHALPQRCVRGFSRRCRIRAHRDTVDAARSRRHAARDAHRRVAGRARRRRESRWYR